MLRYQEFQKPLHKLFRKDIGMPLVELPVLLEPTRSTKGRPFSDRELASRHAYFTFYKLVTRQGDIKCLKLGNVSRQELKATKCSM